jgi:signal transduction histidine kinase
LALDEECEIDQDGLGLAICRQIAHVHGGWLTLEKNEGGGARIGIELPCGDPADGIDKP